jgi:hypothetical protein
MDTPWSVSRSRFWDLLPIVLAMIAIVTGGATVDGAEAPARTRIMVHLMPWFEAPPVAEAWGWHWTMQAFDPGRDVDGRQAIASWYTPSIGPYDSSDPAVIEYQLLTMKVAGIDGVIVDWYGRADFRDHAVLHRATTRIVEAAARMGLEFAICYEDQTVPALVEAGRLAASDRVPHAVGELRWLADHWFGLSSYARLDGRPLLLSFGHSGLDDEEWTKLLDELAVPVAYLSEHRRRPAAVGAFDWPVPQEGIAAARAFNERSAAWPQRIPVAFPRFHDIYAEAKVHASWGHVADDDGATFRETFAAALDAGAAIIQVATWNDGGEGTIVEPSREFGLRDLAVIQEARRASDTRFAWTRDDITLPHRLFAARQRGASVDRERLDRAAAALLAGRATEARSLLSIGN